MSRDLFTNIVRFKILSVINNSRGVVKHYSLVHCTLYDVQCTVYPVPTRTVVYN